MGLFRALLAKDLRLLRADKRAVMINLAAPLVLAPLIGYIFAPKETPASRIDLAVVDLDGSARSGALTAKLSKDDAFEVRTLTEGEARSDIEEGDLTAAVVLPAGLGDHLDMSGLFRSDRPMVRILLDPSREIEGQVVEGLLSRYTMEVLGTGFQDRKVGIEQFRTGLDWVDEIDGDEKERRLWRDFFQAGEKALLAGDAGLAEAAAAQEASGQQKETASEGFRMPVEIASEEVVRAGQPYNSYAHTFAGMLVMFLLFGAVETGGGIFTEQKQGTWRRLRLAPGNRSWALAAKATALFLLSLAVAALLYAVGIAFFGIRVHGTWPGFILVTAAYCLCVAAFSLLLAGLGRSEGQVRGLATFAILVMSFIGGAWFPLWLMPSWMQTAAKAVPTSWAMGGIESATWRGLGLAEVLPDVGALLGFTLVFTVVGLKSFRWDR